MKRSDNEKKEAMCIPEAINSRYVDFCTDFAFKKFFGTAGNEDLLINFLNSLLGREGDGAIQKITYLNTEQIGVSKNDRHAIYDVYCETQSNERFIVEMQNARQRDFANRALYYSSFVIQQQGKKKDNGWDFKLYPVYVIGILNFTINNAPEDKDDVISVIELKNQKNKVFNENLKLIFLEMTKFNKTVDKLETAMDKWLFAMKNMYYLNNKPDTLNEPIFKKLFDEAEIASYNDQDLFAYLENEKYIRDIHNAFETVKEESLEKGMELGVKKGKEIGRAEGLAEGMEKGMAEGMEKGKLAAYTDQVLAKLAKGKTLPEIAEALEIDIQIVEEILKNRG